MTWIANFNFLNDSLSILEEKGMTSLYGSPILKNLLEGYS
jgi:hypothetical protein